MRKTRWSNLFGDVLAVGTVSTIAVSAKHMAKKYGYKYKGFSVNGWYLLDYASNKFLGDGTKLEEKITSMLSKNKNEDSDKNEIAQK